MYRQIVLFTTLLLMSSSLLSQKTALTSEEMAAYQKQAEYLVSYHEGTLNFLGNPEEVVSEKDIIINESYLKVFQNAETQIEDDLDEGRETPLNKNVQAYMKDVIFFFKEVHFAFHISSVEQQINQNDQVYFKVTTNRVLNGITVTGDTIANNLVRYFEINLNQQKKELKIASIYTTKLDEKEELKNWWNNMSTSWKQVFGKSVIVYDTLPFMHILSFNDSSLVTFKYAEVISTDSLVQVSDEAIQDSTMASLDIESMKETYFEQVPDTISIDPSTIYRLLRVFKTQKKLSIAHNHVIRNLEPLSELSDLTELDISFTLIDDLTPIRNLNKLEVLNIEGSAINSLDPIRYLTALKELNCSTTAIGSLDILANLTEIIELNLSTVPFSESDPLDQLVNLKHLNLSNTHPSNYNGVSKLKSLTDLNLSSSSIKNLKVLSMLVNLQSLNIDSTQINSVEPLAGLTSLSILQANYTPISDISSLQNLPELKAIYCDNSKITMQKAMEFMDEKPTCLVVYNSQNLLNWWNTLDTEWKVIFTKAYQITEPITKEQLHQLMSQKELSLGYNKQVTNIEPLIMLHRLENLNLEHSLINDLSPLSSLNNLEILNISYTSISSLEALSTLQNLKKVMANNTSISDLLPLKNNKNLTLYLGESSGLTEERVMAFRKLVQGCVVVYQSEKLRIWWNYLTPAWKMAFQKQMTVPESPSDIELQQLANLSMFTISNNTNIQELTPLNMLIYLERLSIINCGVSNLSPITGLKMLTELHINQNPVSDISMLSKMNQLSVLDLENTSVEDLEGIRGLNNLVSLNISGTRVRSLKYLSQLSKLEELSISNTNIKKLKPLADLNNLKILRCFNTPIKQSKIADFKNEHKNTEVVFY
jgi:Leucine-rich repeat (LRR) protein